MKLQLDKKKIAETTTDLMSKTVGTGKKVAAVTKKNVTDAIDKAKSDSLMRKRKKLNPVFPDQYQSDEFHLPNIIKIVDDAERRGIELCEGAIGYLKTISGVEVLCLYDEAIEFSGLQFIPAPICDAVYYVDGFDRNRFVRTDCIFSKAHEERVAELKNIAYCLGAKRCEIEIYEFEADKRSQKRSMSASERVYVREVQETSETSVQHGESNMRRGKVEIEFDGNSDCTKPELKWFIHDENIKRLIEMRMEKSNSIKTETLQLSGSSSATMSQNTAYAIESVVGSGNVSLSSQAEKEHQSKLIYHIEF